MRPSGVASQGFPGTRRIRRRTEFLRVYERGFRVRARLMTVVVAANDLGVSRLGVSATRKLGAAVIRNRAKRVVREIFRRAVVPPGLDVVVIPRPDLLDADYRAVEGEFTDVLRRAGRRRRAT